MLSAQGTLAEQHQAFGQLVARFQDMAYGYAYSLVGNPQLAEEAAQEAFVVAWKRLHQLEQPCVFPAWLKQIVFTQCYSLLRRPQVGTISLEASGIAEEYAPAAAEPRSAWEVAERRDAVRQAIRQLPEGERITVVLCYISQYTWKEIAEFLGVSPLAVKKRLASARKRLKKGLMSMVQEDLYAQRPSQDPLFTQKVLLFCQQFGHLLRCGTPILSALKQCSDAQPESERLQEALGARQQTVEQGGSLAAVMVRFGDVFPASYAQAIGIGEETGTLDHVLDRLVQGATFQEESQLTALSQQMHSIAAARTQLPQIMAHFPHLFLGQDLTAVAIGEEKGMVASVVHRLSCGECFDSEATQQTLREEMLVIQARRAPSESCITERSPNQSQCLMGQPFV